MFERGVGRPMIGDSRTQAYTLVRITLSYAVAGVIVSEYGYVMHSAPIYSWMIGKKITECCGLAKSKGGECLVMNDR